jgi:hypothetical protein
MPGTVILGFDLVRLVEIGLSALVTMGEGASTFKHTVNRCSRTLLIPSWSFRLLDPTLYHLYLQFKWITLKAL